MELKEICALIVTALLVVFTGRYCYQIHKKDGVSPTLSTWILFLAGVGLSLVTYLLNEDFDVISGVNNTVDILVVIVVIASILRWGDKTVRFLPWEKYYLAVAGLVALYAAITGDLFNSNLVAQFLIAVGAFPMWHKMITQKRNTESFTAWGLVWTAHAVGLIPSFAQGGNMLSATYVIRGLVSITITFAFMIYFELRTRRSKEVT